MIYFTHVKLARMLVVLTCHVTENLFRTANSGLRFVCISFGLRQWFDGTIITPIMRAKRFLKVCLGRLKITEKVTQEVMHVKSIHVHGVDMLGPKQWHLYNDIIAEKVCSCFRGRTKRWHLEMLQLQHVLQQSVDPSDSFNANNQIKYCKSCLQKASARQLHMHTCTLYLSAEQLGRVRLVP